MNFVTFCFGRLLLVRFLCYKIAICFEKIDRTPVSENVWQNTVIYQSENQRLHKRKKQCTRLGFFLLQRCQYISRYLVTYLWEKKKTSTNWNEITFHTRSIKTALMFWNWVTRVQGEIPDEDKTSGRALEMFQFSFSTSAAINILFYVQGFLVNNSWVIDVWANNLNASEWGVYGE